jgi:hypothetical protein
MTRGLEAGTSGFGYCVAREEASHARESQRNGERRSSDQAESIGGGPLGPGSRIRSDLLVTHVTSLTALRLWTSAKIVSSSLADAIRRN